MQLMKLSTEQIISVYNENMVSDFPEDELKPLSSILNMVSLGQYTCYGLYDDSHLLGYAYLNTVGDFILLDYLAVVSDKRSLGYGSALLTLIKKAIPDSSTLVIEVENPDMAADEQELSIRNRREQFYLRNGCRSTGATGTVFGVNYRILEMSDTVHTKDQILEAYWALYESMLPKNILLKMIKLGI